MNFIKTFFLTAFVLMSLTLGFIYSIDPYDKYGINIFGLETKAVAMARENKFNMFEHSKKNYEAFILGSSAAHRMHTSDIETATGYKTFNYAVQHTTPEDYLAITRHILSKTTPKLILLQLDFYGLDANFPTDTRFYTSPLKDYLDGDEVTKTEKSWLDQDYLTLDAISDSFKVVWVNAFGKARHLYLEDGNYQKEKPFMGDVKITQFGYENFKIDEKRIKYLETIRKLCEEKGVKLVVWTAPYSYEHWQRIVQDRNYRKYLISYKTRLIQTFGEIYDFNNAGIKEYSTSEYFRDSTHASRELFQVVVQKIFKPDTGKFPEGFGHKFVRPADVNLTRN